MIEIDGGERNSGSMNAIALMEVTAASRSAVLGALATDPVVPSPARGTPVSRPRRRSASSRLAAALWVGRHSHDH